MLPIIIIIIIIIISDFHIWSFVKGCYIYSYYWTPIIREYLIKKNET